MTPTAAAPDQPSRRDDAGATLVELLVAMSILTTVLVVMLSAVVGLSRMTVKTQNTADATGDVRAAYLRLDRDVRYADAISVPGQVSGDWFVEMTRPATGTSGARCSQWRFHQAGSTLQVRTWVRGAAVPTAWSTVAGSLALDPARAPFTRAAAGSAPAQGGNVPLARQQLAVHLLAQRGTGRPAGTAVVDTAFTARNSSAASPGNADTTTAVADLCGSTTTIRSTS